MVRRELGPKAAVLQTRDVRTGGLFRLVPGMRRVEVTASASVHVPSRMPRRAAYGARSFAGHRIGFKHAAALSPPMAAPEEPESRNAFRNELKGGSPICIRWSKTSAGDRNESPRATFPARCSPFSPI